MKNNIINKIKISIFINGVIFSAFASASENNTILTNGYYVQLNGGATLGLAPNGDYGTKKAGISELIGIEAGYQITEQFRTSVSLDYLVGFSFNDIEYSEDPIADINHITDRVVTSVTKTQFKISSFVTLINAYYNITTEFNGFTPYIVGGIGISRNSSKGTQVDSLENEEAQTFNIPNGKKINFAFKVGLGTKYSINPNMDFDLRYQFINLGKIKSGTNAKFPKSHRGSLKSHQFLLGVIYKF